MTSAEQPLNFYMPCIYWHDRQGILTVDVCRQQYSINKKDSEKILVYKIATASMQKEIRIWNFWFEKAPHAKRREQFKAAPIAEAIGPKMAEAPINLPKKSCEQNDDDEESIICLEDRQKENETKNTEIKMEVEDHKEVEEIVQQGDSEQSAEARRKQQTAQQSLSVEFMSNIEGHRFTTNVVKFSPNGIYIASGDADGFLFVWKLAEKTGGNGPMVEIAGVSNKNQQKAEGPESESAKGERKKGDPEMDIPPNKENWVRALRTPFRHDADVTAVCWSPDSQMIASVSMDDSVAVHRVDTGKRLWAIRGFRHFTNGIVWDPRGKYLITLSTDRRMDVLDAFKGTRLRSCHQIEFPPTLLPQSDGIQIIQQPYKVFHDDQLVSFQRGVDFSPCGGVVFAPTVHLEVGANNLYGTFAFLRSDLGLCRPAALFPTIKPTIQAKCSPVLYKLFEGSNFLGLPHRLIFAVLCRDSILIYSSQSESPLAYIENIQYDKLTSLAWTPDGQVLVISSMEGFNSFITVDPKKLGTACETQQADFFNQNIIGREQTMTPTKTELPTSSDVAPTPTHPQNVLTNSLPDSPKLITPRKPRAKKAMVLTPIRPDGSNTKSDPQEKRTMPIDSPKTVIPRKKPKKLQTMQISMEERQGNSGSSM